MLLTRVSLTASGQKVDAVAKAPDWLAPFPQMRDQSAAASGQGAYTALAPVAAVISHYEQHMRAAGVTFQTKSNGIGVSIEASADTISAVVRIREDDGSSKVNVSYALKPVPPPVSCWFRCHSNGPHG
jgi:hypothetical protein